LCFADFCGQRQRKQFRHFLDGMEELGLRTTDMYLPFCGIVTIDKSISSLGLTASKEDAN